MGEPDHRPGEDEEWTCGKGLAHHSVVPAKMAHFLAVLAKVLRTHLPTIDAAEPAGRAEWEAYHELTTKFAGLAEELERTAGRMRGCGDLAAAPHHEEVLSDPILVDVFAELVETESELAELLRRSAAEDLAMLRGIEPP